jgi:hypothetical protein
MPAYAKVSLVSPVFHPSDAAFARAWGQFAPGIGGWTVLLDNEAEPTRVLVSPPGGVEPVFFVRRDTRDVVLERKQPLGEGDDMFELGRFDGLREAMLALCPLSDDALEEIHIDLEQRFPRLGR